MVTIRGRGGRPGESVRGARRRPSGGGALATGLAVGSLIAHLIAGCDRTSEGPVFARGEAPGPSDQPAVPVAVSEAVEGAISTYYSATATLEVDKETEVLARIRGIVRSIEVEEGDRVEPDQTLLEIDNEEYAFVLARAESHRRNLQASFDRMQELSEDLVSVEEFETVQRDLRTAEADEGLARLNVSYLTVKAPFGGTIVRRMVDVGANVSVGTPLFSLADLEPLLARVHVPAKEFRKIQTDQTVDLVLDSTDASLEGRIQLVSPTIDPKTGTIKVTVEVTDYPEGTRPGDFAEVRIVTERHEGSTLISRIAVITDKGEQVVFVDMNGAAERRVVEIGFTDDDRAEVLRGLRLGERVVVKGQRSLKHGAPLKVLEELPVAGSGAGEGEGS